MQLRLQALKPEITQICWQEWFALICKLRWFLRNCKKTVQKEKTDEIKNLGKRSVENHMGDFVILLVGLVSPDIWHEMLQRNVWKHEP